MAISPCANWLCSAPSWLMRHRRDYWSCWRSWLQVQIQMCSEFWGFFYFYYCLRFFPLLFCVLSVHIWRDLTCVVYVHVCLVRVGTNLRFWGDFIFCSHVASFLCLFYFVGWRVLSKLFLKIPKGTSSFLIHSVMCFVTLPYSCYSAEQPLVVKVFISANAKC